VLVKNSLFDKGIATIKKWEIHNQRSTVSKGLGHVEGPAASVTKERGGPLRTLEKKKGIFILVLYKWVRRVKQQTRHCVHLEVEENAKTPMTEKKAPRKGGLSAGEKRNIFEIKRKFLADRAMKT